MYSFHRLAVASASLALCGASSLAFAQATLPTLVDPKLGVRAVVSGLAQPTQMAFLSANDFLVLEKATGQVKRVVSGRVQSIVLDLAVNSVGERGLLSIALHPDFPRNPGVYLYWTQSSTGFDSEDVAAVTLLANRVDRFIWTGSALVFERNIISTRCFEDDAAVPQFPFHDAGVIRFAPPNKKEKDKTAKLFIALGDAGRRGYMQNNLQGPVPDDQFGGPQPDDAHLRGVVLRVNDDGSTPPDNPFFAAGSGIAGQFGANVQKLFAYGIRNSFGMDFEPKTGELWMAENGDDSFTEINRVLPGHNGGWIQVMGPLSRIAEYKQIETTLGAGTLHQLRWPPSLIANTPAEAQQRMYTLPGSHYSDPQFSWKYEVPPAGMGFMRGGSLGKQYDGNLFVASGIASAPASGVPGAKPLGGQLFRFKLASDRSDLRFNDPRLNDRVADNLDKRDTTESESLLFGFGFGIGADVLTGPHGNLFVVSLTDGTVYEIFRK